MPTTHDYYEDPRNEDIQIYINGEFFHRAEATVSVLDSGFLLGDGVWEGIRLNNGKLLHLKEHLDRLYAGANLLSLPININPKKLEEAIQQTLDINQMKSDVHIRLIVSRGLKKTPYQHPKATIGDPTIVIIPEYKVADQSVSEVGIKLATVETIRDYRVQNPNINSLSKHNCIAACIEAEKKGADEGLMFDPNGYVSTCNSTNFFIVRNGEVWTSTGEYCLKGITRSIVIDLCKENNIHIYEKNFSIDDVYTADEVFVTGTFAGLIPVIKIDDRQISAGQRGRYTKKLQNHYKDQLFS
ncbi:MAG: aminotransferase class IV [Candidatus Neomarinimicrobiota bacterium]|nr:aminotransferase class IV [Candidatus Neomarinimicrobiota bacterium]